MTKGKRLEKPNNRRLPLRAWLLYLVVVTFALTGVTFSRYVTSSHSRDEARVATFGQLQVVEPSSGAPGGEWLIAPGADIMKNARVTFSGSETAVYLFVELETPGWTRNTTDNMSYSCMSGQITWRVADGWTYLCNEGANAVYYRVEQANANVNAPVIADGGRITVSENITRSQLAALPTDPRIDIHATAVQLTGFDSAQAAWNTVK